MADILIRAGSFVAIILLGFLLKKIGSHQQKRFFPIFTLKKLIRTSWKNFYLTSYIRIKFC